MADNYFLALFNTSVSDHIEKKNGLSYVSWPYAWAEVKKQFPDATYTIYENKDGWFYHTDGRTCWVKTGLTVNGIEHIEMLPVMDFRNRSIPLNEITSMDVNKAIQRSLTKAAARHGIGLYVYAGEDLPEEEAEARRKEQEAKKEQAAKVAKPSSNAEVTIVEKVPPANPVKAYVANEITFMMQMFEETDKTRMLERFGKMRKALVDGGVIPNIPADEQTMEQAKQMIDAIYKNFTPKGEMK